MWCTGNEKLPFRSVNNTFLDLVDLHTYYGDSHVLQGATLAAERGKVTAVLGRNGVGKTTLLKALLADAPDRPASPGDRGHRTSGP